MKTIEQILHYKNIMGVVDAIKGGLPTDIVPARMLQPTKRVPGNKGTYYKRTSTRKVARTVKYGAPSTLRSMEGIADVPVNLFHSYEHINHDPNLLPMLKSLDGGTQKLGAEIVAKEAADFTQLFHNLRLAAWFSALTLGKIYFDGDGNLLSSSSGAVVTIDFGIPDGNKDQLNVAGNGTIITDSWATASTDIPKQISVLIKQAMAFTGYRPKYAIYGSNIPDYLASNTSMKEFLKMHPASNEAVRNGDVPNSFAKMTWIDGSHAFYNDNDGNNKFFWDDDMVVFLPDPTDMGWWGLIEGSYAVPTNINIQTNATAALASLANVSGMFSYAKVVDDPVTVRQYAGDTVLPIISVPNSVFIADVTP
ncbi:hypothetical protein DRH27_02955 [Candidatus Falkowbacteria bacterium]|nr:MAG: hypothetical protein DRH27_02955 [Candidatus Falkowbacteria bacterium]